MPHFAPMDLNAERVARLPAKAADMGSPHEHNPHKKAWPQKDTMLLSGSSSDLNLSRSSDEDQRLAEAFEADSQKHSKQIPELRELDERFRFPKPRS